MSSHPEHSPRSRRTERLVVLAIAGLLAFNYPLLELFNVSHRWLGIPLLYLYLFLAWGAFIGLVAWTLELRPPSRRRDKPRDADR